MKELIEYHPNGNKKHVISYHPNGNKWYEQYYDLQGRRHREHNLPDYQAWNENGITDYITYCVHGIYHNNNNPACTIYNNKGKISFKYYILNNHSYSKLIWMNLIKNI